MYTFAQLYIKIDFVIIMHSEQCELIGSGETMLL